MQFLALLFAVSVAHAQPAPAQTAYSEAELDQMLAPVALYPDGLLSQVLMAATYPSEVAEAAGWANANPGYKGDAAVRAAEGMPWDLSVKSLLPFPQMLNTMAENMEWTERLGNAFIGQQPQVMDAIQRLRHRAMEAGYLVSDSRIKVTVKDQLISIYPVKPSVVHVPYYNPTVVYGTWSSPDYAPVYWDPWPGYTSSNRGWVWAAGTVVGVGLLYGAFDWHRRHVREHHSHRYYDRHHGYRDRYRGHDRGPRNWSRDTHKPRPTVRTRSTGTRFSGGRLTGSRVAPTGARPGVSGRPGPTGTRPGVAGRPDRTGAKPGVTGRPGPTGTRPGVTGRTAPTGTKPGVTKRPTTPGAKSTSGRGTNPPGEARGIRGTQPGQARGTRGTQPSGTRSATQRQSTQRQQARPTQQSRPAAAQRQQRPQQSRPQPQKREKKHD